eukprot:gnl/MRDRNA2_/MRDRNA2_29264_c0_seq1.p1 gnl/MRDRNA2_/MRDRNA2_29264_c0~~gnl/MRDRNA2_/MRDRNA2_29264_c0_seq1.p1  ORF type:complete len:369 (+),score=85.96 gnl/MRDRNA2_/MRDRNA2_29264_c0_seq1:86-1192(+)
MGPRSEALPLAWTEDSADEHARLSKYKEEDPISLQDALNTSQAFVEAARNGDVEELKRVVDEAEEGEILQGFAAQAMIIAVRQADLDVVEKLIAWGLPVDGPGGELEQAVHLACEITNRENFSKTWRIVKALTEGNESGGIHIDSPRMGDGWTPLCVACADACVPLAFKLLEMKADPNVITRRNETPLVLARCPRPHDKEETKEARNILTNMLKDYGAKGTAGGVLADAHGVPLGQSTMKAPAPKPTPTPTIAAGGEKGGGYPAAASKKKVVLSMSSVAEVGPVGTESAADDSALVLDATSTWDEDQTREVIINPITMKEKAVEQVAVKYFGHDGKEINPEDLPKLEDRGPVTSSSIPGKPKHTRFCG